MLFPQSKPNRPNSRDLISLPQAHGSNQESRPSHHNRRENRGHDEIDAGLAEQVSRQAQDISRHVRRNPNVAFRVAGAGEGRRRRNGGDERDLGGEGGHGHRQSEQCGPRGGVD